MCRTSVISNRIVRLGTRSFRQRIEAAAGEGYRRAQLTTLNRDIESFCELLHDDFNSITADDYRIFGPQLDLLLDSIDELHSACKGMPSDFGFSIETKRLETNKSTLHELKYDIENFRLDSKTAKRFSPLMASASAALSSL